MKRTLGISATAIAAALLAASVAMPALACMEMDEQASVNALRVPGVPVAGATEPAVINPAEKYVILAPVRPGAPPKIVRVGGIDVSPAPDVLVVNGRAVTQDAMEAVAFIDSPRVLQEAQFAK
jgi:hypothetical protein